MFNQIRVPQGTVRQTAVAAAGLVFVSVSILLSQRITESGTFGLLVASVVGIVSLGHIISFFTWCGLRWWARSFLGVWYYFSDSTQQLKSGHYARVEFYVKQSELHYSVQIYSAMDITGVLEDRPGSVAASLGHASSRAVFYDGDQILEVLYFFEPKSGIGGLGLLKLAGVRHGREMSGEWVTARSGSQAAAGTSRWFRHTDFRAYLAATDTPPGTPWADRDRRGEI